MGIDSEASKITEMAMSSRSHSYIVGTNSQLKKPVRTIYLIYHYSNLEEPSNVNRNHMGHTIIIIIINGLGSILSHCDLIICMSIDQVQILNLRRVGE